MQGDAPGARILDNWYNPCCAPDLVILGHALRAGAPSPPALSLRLHYDWVSLANWWQLSSICA